MITVGLTGGFASGKTTVAQMFKAQGASFVSADGIVHGLLKGRGRCAQRVRRVFGRGVISAGRIDHKKLAQVVFNDPVQRKTLERIIHPEVIREIERHKWFESEKAGRDVGFEWASKDWISRYGQQWKQTHRTP